MWRSKTCKAFCARKGPLDATRRLIAEFARDAAGTATRGVELSYVARRFRNASEALGSPVLAPPIQASQTLVPVDDIHQLLPADIEPQAEPNLLAIKLLKIAMSLRRSAC